MTFLPPSRLLAEGRADDHPVAVRAGETVSFGRFRAEVAGTAARLAGCRRAGLVCADAYGFAVGLFALAHAGAEIVVPPSAQPGVLAELGGSWDRLVTDADLVAGEGPLAPLADVAVDFFTSGSTGAPKRVPRRLAQFDAEVAMIEALWPGGGLTLATVPHQHVYGLAFRLLWPLAAGRVFSAAPHEVWETVLAELQPGAVIVSSPAHLARLGGFAPVAARPRMVLTAGAPLPAAAARDCLRVFGVLPTEIYGSTETGAIATRMQERPDAAWRPLPGVDVRQGGDGRLELCSPWAGPGWVATEDRVERSGDGFTLLGRADRVAKIEGKRVSLPRVEEALGALPQVAEAAVVALSGRRDEVAAAVVPTPAGRAELDRLGPFRFGRVLRSALAGTLEPLARPRRWRFVEAIPAAALGKRSNRAIVALFEDEPMPHSPREPEITAIRRTEAGAELDMVIPETLHWFRGHFPAFAILPGVVQLDWALAMGAAHLGLATVPARQFQVKYKAPIRPGDRLTLSLAHVAGKNRLDFTYRRDGEACSSGQVALA